jgi:hypothetical protein
MAPWKGRGLGAALSPPPAFSSYPSPMNKQTAGTAAILLLITACSGADRTGDWAGTLQDSAGVTIVENPANGFWREGEGWTVEEELRIGSFAADPNYQFGQVGWVAVNSAGEIFISDTQAQDIRVYSSEGAYLQTLGGPGAGPGELGSGASALLITPGDTLLVPDPRNRRVNRYASDGSSLGSIPLNPERERALRYNLTPNGYATVQLRPVQPPNQAAVETQDALTILDPSGATGDTLFRMPSGGLFQGAGIHYFTPEPMWEITDSLTVLFGMNSEYRIAAYDREGSLRRVISRSFEPSPISDRDIRALFYFLDQAWEKLGLTPAQIEQNHSLVHFAEVFPAYFSFQLGYEGSLWVQPIRPPGDLPDEEMARYNFAEDFGDFGWEVFDREGRFMGVVTMPYRFQPRTFLGDKIYGVWRDDLDVQYVLRLKVVEGQG